MKSLRILCLSLPLVLGGCLTEYSSTEYTGGYGSSGSSYYGSSAGRYRNYDTYQPGYYSGGYGRPYYGGSYGYNDYRYNQNRDCDDNDHSSSSSKKKSSSDRDIRIVDYDQNRRRGDLPDGYHPPEWWKERGYSLSQNSYKTREGDVKGKAAQEKHKSSSSNNKSSSSSSSSKKKK